MMNHGIGSTVQSRSIGIDGVRDHVLFVVRWFLRREDYALDMPSATGSGS